MRFPGQILLPPTTPGEEARRERNDRAISIAGDHETDTRTFWTDGSALPGGGRAGAVVGYVKGKRESSPEKERILIERDGIVGCGQRPRGEGKRGGGKTYKGQARTFIRTGNESGMRAEAWCLKGEVTAFDAELSALVRGIGLCYLQASRGTAFNIFTDSRAAMTRLQDDRAGPGQQTASRGILTAMRARGRGASITINWVPGHAGVPGNEVADQWASEAAIREARARRGNDSNQITTSARVESRPFLKSRLRKRAHEEWRKEIRSRTTTRRPYRVPREDEIPRIPRALRKARKELEARFFQLSSGHAMIAPFLREKFGWIDSDICWWCSNKKQSRKHLFKECRAWKEEIRQLWKTVGDISGGHGERPIGPYKGSKGFMLRTTRGSIGPGNCSVERLFGDPRFTEAILTFLTCTGVGKIKKGCKPGPRNEGRGPQTTSSSDGRCV